MKKNPGFLPAAIFLLLVISVSLISLCLFVWPLSTTPALKIFEPKPLILQISGHPEWSPIMWQSGDQLIGVGPDLVAKIFSELKVPFEIKPAGTWDQVLEKAKANQIDVLVAAYKTEARQQYLAYSVAYTVDPIALFVKKNSKLKYEKWSDLIGKKGIAMIGDSYGQEFDDYISANLKVGRVLTAKEAFDSLEKKSADYFVYALYSGQRYINQNGLQAEFIALPKEVTSENFYIAIAKKSTAAKYLPQINELIEKYKDDGTIDQLLEKYQSKSDLDEE